MATLRRALVAAAAALLLTLLSVGVSRASAAIITVPCNQNDLIDAILDANANFGPDTLELATDCVYPLTTRFVATDSGLPAISSDITINGNGATIGRDAAPSFQYRIFWVDTTGVLSLDNLTIVNGRARDGVPMPPGTQGQNGGAALVHGALTVTNSTISGNAAGDGYSQAPADPAHFGGTGGNGGAIYLASLGSSVSIINSTIGYNNRAGNGGNGHATLGSGDGGRGGAIYLETGTLNIVNSTIFGNTAGNGGTTPHPARVVAEEEST